MPPILMSPPSFESQRRARVVIANWYTKRPDLKT